MLLIVVLNEKIVELTREGEEFELHVACLVVC